MTEYLLYGTDCETTGLAANCNPIEISLYRLSTDECKTWCLKPINIDAIQPEALRVNGHKREDILGLTKEGRERYRKPENVLVEIENWLMDDGMPADQRLLLGHNVNFDKEMLISLWNRCNSYETFPFSPKYGIDTMQIEFFFDYVSNKFGEGYSLRNLAHRYKIRQDKAHTAEDDTKVMVSIFQQQVNTLKNANTIRSQSS